MSMSRPLTSSAGGPRQPGNGNYNALFCVNEIEMQCRNGTSRGVGVLPRRAISVEAVESGDAAVI